MKEQTFMKIIDFVKTLPAEEQKEIAEFFKDTVDIVKDIEKLKKMRDELKSFIAIRK